ncbi:ATPase [[Phormidium ambiguum] IAM M-71]|uniref:ATPase n=1 Tax=[Phormidium ambiguum] IAM M-71 TaxID=454136 RepID=A0A1U7IFG7_9CYAN|nr:MoxR family ATPase [Phormidium ambiguum]OKH35693.1 ATPase [Phormidium ambiguum IAM M-71]
MKRKVKYKFTGNLVNPPQNSHPDSPQKPEPYIADRELIQAVNLAIYLRRPLLLEGEAGCGKTRLAAAVAYELGLPFYRWDVRSTSKAQEGLYKYDALLRLHDVQAQKVDSKLNRDPSNPTCYRQFGALGRAFCLKDCPALVLIDEIDKADLDFPNDLLAVLDEPWAFEIPETGEIGDNKIKATHEPIIIITSNKEKGNLPAPFLRRCVYYFIKFPSDSEQLRKIVDVHYQAQAEDSSQETSNRPVATKPSLELIKSASERFLAIRKAKGLFREPGTSEFLDWLNALQSFDSQPYSPSKLETINPLPYRELLFKQSADWEKYASAS